MKAKKQISKISKTKIERKLKRKTKPELVKTILLAKKQKANLWLEIAKLLSMPKRKQIKVNLDKIEKQTTEGDTVIVPGKVLSSGNVSKKIIVCAFAFSQEAIEKLKKSKSEIVTIAEEIKKNPNAQGIKIIK